MNRVNLTHTISPIIDHGVYWLFESPNGCINDRKKGVSGNRGLAGWISATGRFLSKSAHRTHPTRAKDSSATKAVLSEQMNYRQLNEPEADVYTQLKGLNGAQRILRPF